MVRSRRTRASGGETAVVRRRRAVRVPEVPTVSPATEVVPEPVEPGREDPAEEAIRRMVEAAYT